MSSRREALQERYTRSTAPEALATQTGDRDKLFRELCLNIRDRLLIPIIGDTVRNELIFDIDFDQELGIDEDSADAGSDDAPAPKDHPDEPDLEENDKGRKRAEPASDALVLPQRELSITEQLAVVWAKRIGYPLVDQYRIVRVAQYHAINTNPLQAKRDYLRFQKSQLLREARKAAMSDRKADESDRKADENDRRKALGVVEQLEANIDWLSFASIAQELGLPRLEEGEDPLDLLASLPVRIFVTTGYYDFLERALRDKHKQPRTHLCLWNMDAVALKKEHRLLPGWEPTTQEPMVYHLFGLEDYPESMVVSEDDYVEFLMRLAQDKVGDDVEKVIAPYVSQAVRSSALLLLGYRLHDWDFRVLFHVLKEIDRRAMIEKPGHTGERQRPAVAIQLVAEKQFEIAKDGKAMDRATDYLTRYFGAAKLQVDWDRTDSFVTKLWDQWQERQGRG
jgi:hypothetical protein